MLLVYYSLLQLLYVSFLNPLPPGAKYSLELFLRYFIGSSAKHEEKRYLKIADRTFNNSFAWTHGWLLLCFSIV